MIDITITHDHGQVGFNQEQKTHYLFDRLTVVINSLNELQSSLTKVVYAEPAKPREGMFVFADGTTWDPGSGRGLYQYVSGAWAKL